MQSYPLHSLTEGSWFKLICGASYQHLPMIRNLALAYSLAGADCVDVAADPAVIAAAQEGIKAAADKSPVSSSPWLMVSINDGEDPHFRKAQFDSAQCASNCPQPCVQVCPAEAINLSLGGVINDLCYGCGRCVPICPQQLVETESHQSSTKEVFSWINDNAVDAVEIHTQVGHYDDFKQVWQDLKPIASQLKLLAISCTDSPGVVDYLRALYELLNPLPCTLIWQTDGRSMSGDIGKGATHAAINFAQKLLQADIPGNIQLAGGTNDHTVRKLQQLKLLKCDNSVKTTSIAGVAYGSYARALLSPILNQLDPTHQQSKKFNLPINQPMNQLNLKLEHNQELLEQAVQTASQLVNQLKTERSFS